MAERHRGDRRLECPAGTQRMPVETLGPRHWYGCRVRTQRQVQRLGLRQLVELRAGRVRVHVADRLGLQLRIGQGGADRLRRSFARGQRRSEVVGVRRGAIAGDLRDDGGPAALGRLDLNRKLTDYPSTNNMGIFNSSPDQAIADRVQLARDIYDRLRLVTMGELPSVVPAARSPGKGRGHSARHPWLDR